MIIVIVTIAFLHSHVIVNHVLKTPIFGFGDQCKEWIDSRIQGAQKLANKVFPEKTEVTLKCRVQDLREV